MNKNRSSTYGYYGGVIPANHYIPPPAPEFVPQPASVSTPTTFTAEDRVRLQQLVEQTNFFNEHSGDILLRTQVISTSGNVDTFVLTTSAHPEDVIVYTSENDEFNANIVNGGEF